MVDVSIFLRFKGFSGDSFDAVCKIEDNLFSSMSLLRRNIPSYFILTMSVSQSSSDVFLVTVHVKDDSKSISEDVIIGQIESNFESIKKTGKINIGLHDWEMDSSFK